MKHTQAFVLGSTLFLVVSSGTLALAQDAQGEGAPSSESSESSESAPDASMAAPPPVATAGGDKWSTWSQRVIDRPRTLPAGMIEAGGYFDINRYSTTVGAVTNTTNTLGLTAGGGYGVSDKLEVRASYSLSIDPSEAKGPFAVGAGFGFAEGTLAIAGTGDFTYDLLSESGGIGLGASVRYKLKPELALYTSRQLVMTLIAPSNASKPSDLKLPIGVGYQLNDQLYLFGETELASLNLKDSVSQALFVDYIPITLGGVFALSSKLEAGGLFYTDLKNEAFDAVQVQLFGRAYF